MVEACFPQRQPASFARNRAIIFSKRCFEVELSTVRIAGASQVPRPPVGKGRKNLAAEEKGSVKKI